MTASKAAPQHGDTHGLPFRLRSSDVPDVSDAARLSALNARLEMLRHSPDAHTLAIFDTIRRDDALKTAQQQAVKWQGYSDLVVVGSGGSGLSSRAMAMLAHGLNGKNATKTVHVLDNLDTDSIRDLLSALPLKQTAFLFISKSGNTVETVALSHFLVAALEKASVTDYAARTAFITMEHESSLRALAERIKAPCYAHPEDLCGRFSLLSLVGLIAACFIGVDAEAVLRGAREALDAELKLDAAECPAAQGALAQEALMCSNRNIAVLMPYSEKLYGLTLWWRQSWAESLGKSGSGTTAVPAIGTTDQHSQLQLYLSGPDDKFYTLILPSAGKNGLEVPEVSGELSYLSGKSLHDLVSAQQYATAEALARHHRPLRVFETGPVDAALFGALFTHFTLEIILMAELLGVNSFDQPAVEESKQLARTNLLEE